MKLNDKYRPKTFEEVIGNAGLKKSLKLLLEKASHPHTFLFSGDRGTGKTTIARIACSVLDIDDTNIYELDLADKDIRGIAGASIIKSKSKFRGFGNKKVAFIYDECHQMTKDHANSVLKLFEEPPEHLYIFCCTTDPQQLIKTILSRCTQYQVKAPSSRELIKHLSSIAEQEKMEIDFEHLSKIAESCENTPRDSIKLLEQVMPLADSPDDIEDLIINNISDADEADGIELCRLLMSKNPSWSKASKILLGINKDKVESIRHLILNYITKCLLNSNRYNKDLSSILYEFSEPFYNTGKAGLVRAFHDCICLK